MEATGCNPALPLSHLSTGRVVLAASLHPAAQLPAGTPVQQPPADRLPRWQGCLCVGFPWWYYNAVLGVVRIRLLLELFS